ncbi:hypothetical protein [Rhodanobacter sp. DHB23]|uniref:hypothetical protein n=1 Tax=Rhodanobacter sp. DHB23 TaxID=2775923 RepID=UPI0017868A5B|nr:hypothetical protein [Rhodanobacter sp. DHB23]MBD8873870.1 hypothetical protein [Rhodanobacter sp. DHB23]
MNAKANIQPVPTALDHLRAALTTRDELGKQSAELMAKIERLAPIEAEVALAQSHLQDVMAAEQQKLQTWADKGAKGEPPAVDSAAREQASRRLADAKARLEAAGAVKGSLTDDAMAINVQLQQHRYVIGTTLMDVLGEEVLRTVEGMRKTSLAVLESEAAFFAIREQMQSIRDGLADDANGNTSMVARSFGDWLQAISLASNLSAEERDQAVRSGRTRSLDRLEKLQAGEDPDA